MTPVLQAVRNVPFVLLGPIQVHQVTGFQDSDFNFAASDDLSGVDSALGCIVNANAQMPKE